MLDAASEAGVNPAVDAADADADDGADTETDLRWWLGAEESRRKKKSRVKSLKKAKVQPISTISSSTNINDFQPTSFEAVS